MQAGHIHDHVRSPMESSKRQLNILIHGVCHLCERIQELARTEAKDPVTLVPVREAVQMVSTTLEALCSTWEEEAPSVATSDESCTGNALPEVNWLLDGEFTQDLGAR